jgi:hypothetical protein
MSERIKTQHILVTEIMNAQYRPVATDASGLRALIPKKLNSDNPEDYDTTVLTVGGKGYTGVLVAFVHILFWIGTVVSSVFTMQKLDNATGASGAAKTVSRLAVLTQFFIIIAIVVHAAFCQKGERSAAIATVFLIAFVLFGIMSSWTVFTYCIVLGQEEPFRFSIAAVLCSVLSSSMVITFVIEWSNRGTVVFGS